MFLHPKKSWAVIQAIKKKKEYCVCSIKTEHCAIAGSFVKTQCNEPEKFLFEVKTLQAVMILEL